jgi:hypothetical protein
MVEPPYPCRWAFHFAKCCRAGRARMVEPPYQPSSVIMPENAHNCQLIQRDPSDNWYLTIEFSVNSNVNWWLRKARGDLKCESLVRNLVLLWNRTSPRETHYHLMEWQLAQLSSSHSEVEWAHSRVTKVEKLGELYTVYNIRIMWPSTHLPLETSYAC